MVDVLKFIGFCVINFIALMLASTAFFVWIFGSIGLMQNGMPIYGGFCFLGGLGIVSYILLHDWDD